MVPLEQVGMVGLQLLHLHRLLVHLVLDLLHVDADLAGLLQQLAHRVGGGGVALGQLGHVALDAAHRRLHLRLPLLHLVLVVLHRVQHVDQLVQQRQDGDGVHLPVLRPPRRGGGEGQGGRGARQEVGRLSSAAARQQGQAVGGGGLGGAGAGHHQVLALVGGYGAAALGLHGVFAHPAGASLV